MELKYTFYSQQLSLGHYPQPVEPCLSIHTLLMAAFNPYPTAFPYGNSMVLHFYQQQESSTTKTVYKVINKGLKSLCILASHW